MTLTEGYYYNYIKDASMYYWAARGIELNPALDENQRVLDQVIVRRLRALGDQCRKQGLEGLARLGNISFVPDKRSEPMTLQEDATEA